MRDISLVSSTLPTLMRQEAKLIKHLTIKKLPNNVFDQCPIQMSNVGFANFSCIADCILERCVSELYVSEAWATTFADRPRLDVFDLRCQRRLLRVFWQHHISNQIFRERTKQPTAPSLVGQRRLCWFGHLHRMPSSLHVQRVFDFNPNIHVWKRPRGLPKTRWADVGLCWPRNHQCCADVFDLSQWKAFVCGLPTLQPEQGA